MKPNAAWVHQKEEIDGMQADDLFGIYVEILRITDDAIKAAVEAGAKKMNCHGLSVIKGGKGVG